MPIRGEAFDRATYTGHREIHRGVVVARHEILGENCIQKTYEPAGREDSVAFAEPRLLNELDHPHITPIREAQFDPERRGCVTMVMRVYDGGSVQVAQREGHQFSVSDVIQIGTDVAEALDYLHTTKRLVHRDLKPGNVLLDRSRRVGYVADFGSAAFLDASADDVAAVRTTALYQPPEAAAAGRVGPSADIYALGLTLFEMLNGPFPYAELDAATIDRRINQGHRSLPDERLSGRAFAPHVPRTLARLVLSCMSADPRRRPTAAALTRALRGQRCVDWRLVETGESTVWHGNWPPSARHDRRVELEVTARPVRRGPSRGMVRLSARYRTRTSSGWRTVGVADVVEEAQDSAAKAAFFTAVDAAASNRWQA